MARKKSALEKKRSYIKGLITRANKRIESLRKEGVYFQSFAVQDAIKSKSRAKGVDQSQLFSIEGIKSSKDLDREKARLLSFLGNNTSRPESAKYEYNVLLEAGKISENQQRFNEVNQEYVGKFFAKGLGSARHTDDINDDNLKLAAKIYREIEESRANLIGKAAFDSQTLINLIYDEVDKVRYKRFFTDDKTERHVMKLANDILDEYQEQIASLRVFKKQFNFQRVGKRSKKR